MTEPTTTRYRKKPVEIDAIQWDGTADGATRIIDWILASGSTANYTCSDPVRCSETGGDTPHSISIRTLEGVMQAGLGDWIIRGVKGEFYPCKPDIFAETYEPAAEAQPETPCSVPDPCGDGDLCDQHETEQAHAAGDHGNCGATCEVELPSEMLRNFILAKGYPGTAGALDELLRRAASPDTERLRAERDELLAELDGRDDEARERWIQKQLDKTGIRAMDFRNGAEMELEPARELLAHWVAAARTMLGDAPNYTETRLSMDVKVAESPELYTLVVQRHGPGVLTPHEARQRAEGALAEVLGIVSAWCVEANEVGGVDAGDLAFRLGRAGHPLPDEGSGH